MEKNRKYRKNLEEHLKNIEEKMRNLHRIIEQKKERKKQNLMIKFMEASPYIDFYKYDKDLSVRSKSFIMLNMLNKSPYFKSMKSTEYYEKLITLSTSSEESS